MGLGITSIIPSAPASLDAIIQDRTLERMFHDSLFPGLLYRMEAPAERWEANLGETKVFTRRGLHPVNVRAVAAGSDPLPRTSRFEQWEVLADQYADREDTNMAVSRTALASLFMSNAKNLGLQAAQTLNRLVRNRLYCAYTGGHTVVATAATSASQEVASLNGFTKVVVNGKPVDVSVANPLAITVNGVANTVVGFSAADPDIPFGRGTLTLGTSITTLEGQVVLASNRPSIIRVGGGLSVDSIASTDVLNLAAVRLAVATLSRNNVPTHSDGYYHVHVDPLAQNSIYDDNEFQRLNEGLVKENPYLQFAIGKLVNGVWYENKESPANDNVGTLQQSRATAGAQLGEEIFAEVTNAASVPIFRTIVTGGGAIQEHYIDESEYLSEAGTQGKQGNFYLTNNSLIIPCERIRYIIRAPQDALQQQVTQSWSFSGDWGIPSDVFGGRGNARFKRAIVIEHA